MTTLKSAAFLPYPAFSPDAARLAVFESHRSAESGYDWLTGRILHGDDFAVGAAFRTERTRQHQIWSADSQTLTVAFDDGNGYIQLRTFDAATGARLALSWRSDCVMWRLCKQLCSCTCLGCLLELWLPVWA